MTMKIDEVKFLKSIVEFEEELSPMKREIKSSQVFFLGRSNVGKSSIINSLLGNKNLAHSSAKAGKTRTINFFKVNKNFMCLDFPGYWYARWWKENQERLRDMILEFLEKSLNEKTKIIVIMDSFVWPTEQDIEVFSYLTDKDLDILVVLNKVDKINQKELEATKKKLTETFGNIPYILYSCKNNKYRDEALKAIFG
ncbi:MAG: Ribosome biogenesis GTP-binding protein YsxC [uncultured bacterium (gcode 4)]|uniref:Ribosome biogenesis GTP-binding protein YsxC n=1 Tax=uncultured bacterium (gcode 4) TaxID=1234023 RepID=K2H0E1_9BACT|nr:MAG: Ribosome biogenesis GTP-binding protein YsxC [uncultured bacterium (gcode 4)]